MKHGPNNAIEVEVRLPRSLHRRAAMMAKRDGVTVEEFMLAAIAMRLGAEEARLLEAEAGTVGAAP